MKIDAAMGVSILALAYWSIVGGVGQAVLLRIIWISVGNFPSGIDTKQRQAMTNYYCHCLTFCPPHKPKGTKLSERVPFVIFPAVQANIIIP